MKEKLKRFKASIIISTVIVLVTASISVWALIRHNSARNPFPSDVKNTVSFPIYYPQPLPPGFKLDSNSVQATKDVMLFALHYDHDKSLAISIQSSRSQPDVETFNPTKKFTTHIGTAYLVDLDDRTTAAVIGERSWVLINAPQKISLDTMEQFINSLKPVSP